MKFTMTIITDLKNFHTGYFNYKSIYSLYLFRIFIKKNIDIKDIDKRLFIM